MEQEHNNPAETTSQSPDNTANQVLLSAGTGLDIVKDISVTLTIELGRTRMSLKELLKLEQGSVVELQRMVDEPMDVLVNGTLVAHGEVVVIDDTFGVRLTDIVSAPVNQAA
jgi:flagellar motor switch protein FliN/FliY